MPGLKVPHNHSRRHSWPPFSTRNLRAVAPVHFHLSPASSNPKKRPSSSSSSCSSTSSRPSSSSAAMPPPRAVVRPSTPAVQPSPLLPDIDDDPFAHFLSPMNDDDNPYGDLAFSAGILASEEEAEEEKRDKLRSKLARRWAKYMAKYHGGGKNGKVERADGDRTAEEKERRGQNESDEERWGEGSAVDEGYMSEEGATPVHVKKLQRPAPEPLTPYMTVVREPTTGRAQDHLIDRRMRKKRKYRHSWVAPDFDLFTVVEEGEGVVDSEIEQRYFST